MKNYFSYIVGHCNEKQNARAELLTKERIAEILNFLLLPPISSENTTTGVYIYRNYRILGIVFKITGQLEKHYKQPNIKNTTRTLRNKKNLKTT